MGAAQALGIRNTSCLLSILLLINTSTKRQEGEQPSSVTMTNGVSSFCATADPLPTPPPPSRVDGGQTEHAKLGAHRGLQSGARDRLPRRYPPPLRTHHPAALRGKASSHKEKWLRTDTTPYIYICISSHATDIWFFSNLFLIISCE